MASSSSSAHQRRLPPRPIAVEAAASSNHLSPRITKHSLALKKAVANVDASTNGLLNTPSPPRPSTPRRPMSASRVQSTSASLANTLSSSPTLPKGQPRTRPASASRARVSPPCQPHTISSPSEPGDVNLEDYEDSQCAAPASRPQRSRSISEICSRIHKEQQRPAASIDPIEQAKLRAFLESWQDSEPSFRSAILFSESTFAQAKGWSPCRVLGSSRRLMPTMRLSFVCLCVSDGVGLASAERVPLGDRLRLP